MRFSPGRRPWPGGGGNSSGAQALLLAAFPGGSGAVPFHQRPEREAFALTYESCLPENANISDAVFRALESARGEDIRRGGTSFGPHREDLVLTIQGKDMRLFASQGQMRTAALAMKLSELAVFQQMAGEPPVLLLDDVMSELDLNRRKRLLDEIRGVQTLITCTDESDLNAAGEIRSLAGIHGCRGQGTGDGLAFTRNGNRGSGSWTTVFWTHKKKVWCIRETGIGPRTGSDAYFIFILYDAVILL